MIQNEVEQFKSDISEADMILIGLGEEFDQIKKLKEFSGYSEGKQVLENSEKTWMIPAWNNMTAGENANLQPILIKFSELLSDKNYFVVATSTNDAIYNAPWREGRLVMPCGGSRLKQCPKGCVQGLSEVTAEDRKNLEHFKMVLETGELHATQDTIDLGVCPECGEKLILNNVYTEHYDEKGYIDQWGIYTKWLQGTLNRKLLVLELGVGMQYPSVIRFPFEKVAFYNQKAKFYRINEKLYHLSEDLGEKGIAIAKNAIDWLEYL